ncbi:hypothetical protein [Thiohalorhabdus methylotrophus]|uniref:DUF4064 domain-containing protein n=1 Tax=Thiohalorhabdus methylotrophus TaxID=3242694 RepID=A0ABV4U0J9_9GAMM
MEGKKNIVFGLIYFVATAALGLVMSSNLSGPVAEAQGQKAERFSTLEQQVQSGFMMADEPAVVTGEALLALNNLMKVEEEAVNSIKGGPHAHGNLESMANIVIGILLMFLAVPSAFKQVISWLFLIAAVFHSGMLYLGVVFNQGWAMTVLGTGIGPIALLAGLFLAGIAALMGLRPQVQT